MTIADLELIDAYLDGTLRGSDLEAFGRRLSAEPAFAADVEEQTILRRVVTRYGEARRTAAEVRAALEAEGFFDRMHRKPPSNRWPRRRIGVYALIALVLVLLGIYWIAEIRTAPNRTEPGPTEQPGAFYIPENFREDRLDDAQAYLNSFPGVYPRTNLRGNRPEDHRAALTALETRLAKPIISGQHAVQYYYAALICLYGVADCAPAHALAYLEAALPHAQGEIDRQRFTEEYIIALLMTGQDLKAKAIYAENPDDYFFGYRALQRQLRK